MDPHSMKENQNRLYYHAWPSNFNQVYDISRPTGVWETCYETLIEVRQGITALD